MTLKYDLPRVLGRRVFDRAGLLWRCRLCGRGFKPDSVWPHFEVEFAEANVILSADVILGLRIDLAMLRRRNRRNRKNAQRAYMDNPEWHERGRQEAKARKKRANPDEGWEPTDAQIMDPKELGPS